ncbi:MAG TPA: glutamate--tRNA ligase [Candidatus Saccharimonadales bacterium]|jgi:nondiscriminating glutamyl-tRNA synthetase|nr:glutamate--tRNA ligase [Candidatus Saccharimonadales bacterium]
MSNSTSSKARVRFAPSPTGQLHVGNARTALVNWLFARQQGGSHILRIEDTDLERSEVRFEAQLIDDLKWLGLDWDEGPDIGGPHVPYRQSDRMDLYRVRAEQLIQQQKAYYCFCTVAELERERESALAEHRSPNYSGKCRNLSGEEVQKRRAAGEPAAIRLRIPERPIRFHDIVRGQVQFDNESVSDLIIMRSSGVPVYNYVVVVDDIEMQITHVIRGDDHLSNTPKQVALYEALGSPVPEFAHLSTILGPDRERLSKRHGATSIANFREMGVLPEALVNYLVLLGWAPSGGNRETFTPQELIKEFSLQRVTPSPAIFDMEKLHWLNRHYIKQGPLEKIHALAQPFFQKAGLLPEQPAPEVDQWSAKLVSLLAPYVDKLEELPQKAASIFRYDAKAAVAAEDNRETLSGEKTRAVVAAFCTRAGAEASLAPERFKAIMNEIKAETGAKGKDLFHPVRVVLTGSHSGPDFDKVIPLLEEGYRLALPVHVKSVAERIIEFTAAF